MKVAHRRRLAVIRFFYEGNAFCPIRCTREDFERREWLYGDQALEVAYGTATELGAVRAFASARPDWEIVPLRCASANPAGPIDEAVYKQLESEVIAGLSIDENALPWDAVYLSLHGAAITDNRQSPDLDLVRTVRAQLGGHTPIGASFDMHANLNPELGSLLDMASGYKTYPHIDMFNTAERVLQGLVRIVETGLQTRVSIFKPALVLSSFNMRTEAGPMRDLQELAKSLSGGPIIDASVFGGFPYADTEQTGAAVLLVTDAAYDPNDQKAAQATNALLDAMTRLKPLFSVTLPTAREGLDQALNIANNSPGLVAVTDPGDNPYSGGVCDTTALFQALIDSSTSLDCVFASFADAMAVESAYSIGEGGYGTFLLGGRHNKAFGSPVKIRARVEKLTQGEFRNVGPMEHGACTRCGRTVLLSLVGRANLKVILTESVAPANDPGFFEMHGIDLSTLRILCVKAKNHFRAAFKERCLAIIDVDAPGPAALNLSLLPFKHAKHDHNATPKDTSND